MPKFKFFYLAALYLGLLFNIGCGSSAESLRFNQDGDVERIAENDKVPENDDEDGPISEEISTPTTPLSLCDDPSLVESFPLSTGSNTGAQLANRVSDLQGARRDDVLVNDFLCGRTPQKLKRLQAVKLNHRGDLITLCVSPDYLSFGVNEDSIRFPLGLPAALEVLGNSGFILPTPKIVDLIYDQSINKIAPSFMTPGPQMESTNYVKRHNNTIDGQLSNLDFGLTAGHKKDVVISNRLLRRPNRIAIYGWHRLNGSPIQSLSTVHHDNYGDYSQGVRLVSAKAFLNNQLVSLKDLLLDSDYASALSYEGLISKSVLDRFEDTSATCE